MDNRSDLGFFDSEPYIILYNSCEISAWFFNFADEGIAFQSAKSEEIASEEKDDITTLIWDDPYLKDSGNQNRVLSYAFNGTELVEHRKDDLHQKWKIKINNDKKSNEEAEITCGEDLYEDVAVDDGDDDGDGDDDVDDEDEDGDYSIEDGVENTSEDA